MKKLLLLMIILVVAFQASAQRKIKELDDQKSDEKAKESQYEEAGKDNWKDKLFFGGNLGGSFGSGGGSLLIQPLVGYKLTERFAVGLSPLYIYNSQIYVYNNKQKELSTHVFGPGVFMRFKVVDAVFLYSEYLGLSYTRYRWNINKADFDGTRDWSNSLFLGGGYSGGGGYVMLLYDVLWDANNSIYQSPLDIRIGFWF